MKTGKMIVTIAASVVFLILASVLSQGVVMALLAMAGVPAWLYHIAGGLLYAVLAYLMVRLFCTKYLKTELSVFLIPKCRIQVKWAVAAVLLPMLVTVVYLFFAGRLYCKSAGYRDKAGICDQGDFRCRIRGRNCGRDVVPWAAHECSDTEMGKNGGNFSAFPAFRIASYYRHEFQSAKLCAGVGCGNACGRHVFPDRIGGSFDLEQRRRTCGLEYDHHWRRPHCGYGSQRVCRL